MPRLFASQPDEARTALQSDPAKAFKDLQRIHSRLFIAENIPVSEAWSFVGNPRQNNIAFYARINILATIICVVSKRGKSFNKVKIGTKVTGARVIERKKEKIKHVTLHTKQTERVRPGLQEGLLYSYGPTQHAQRQRPAREEALPHQGGGHASVPR